MIKSRPTPQNPPSNLQIAPGGLVLVHPFKASIISIDNVEKICSISINRFSNVVKSQSVLDNLDILGRNLKLNFPYGSKCWLEILFDRNREPVIGFIRVGNKWVSTVRDSKGASTEIYPKCEEFISKLDLTDKVAEIDALISYIDELKTSSQAELLFQKNNGVITESQYQVANSSAETEFSKRKKSITEYKEEMPKFFSSAPSASWKKLFKIYLLIAYSTKDTSSAMPGSSAYFSKEGSAKTPDVPQAAAENSYRIVQCAHSDFLLQDSWYNDSYPSKVLVPCPRPVHTFYDGQETEEDKNT